MFICTNKALESLHQIEVKPLESNPPVWIWGRPRVVACYTAPVWADLGGRGARVAPCPAQRSAPAGLCTARPTAELLPVHSLRLSLRLAPPRSGWPALQEGNTHGEVTTDAAVTPCSHETSTQRHLQFWMPSPPLLLSLLKRRMPLTIRDSWVSCFSLSCFSRDMKVASCDCGKTLCRAAATNTRHYRRITELRDNVMLS